MHGHRAFLVGASIAAALAAVAARAGAIELGQVIGDVTLRQLDGAETPLVDRGAAATAVIFFKAQQERSQETLKLMAQCQPQLAGKPVRWVGVVPAGTVAAEARAMVAASGVRLPVLVDEADAVYGKLGMRTHPGVAVVDRARKLVAYEAFHPVGYCEIVAARLRRALGEITDADVAKTLAPPDSQLPGGDDVAGVARRHVSFGRKLLATKAFKQAHENARRAAVLAPSAEAWALEGDIFRAEGRCADAAKAFEKALAIDPKDPAAVAGKQRCGR